MGTKAGILLFGEKSEGVMTKAFIALKAAEVNITLNVHHTRTTYLETNSGSHFCQPWCWATQWSNSVVNPIFMDRQLGFHCVSWH